MERLDPESTAFLEIYYEQMSYEVLTEREAYSFVNFMSDVGGQAGLWLGASIITLFEFLYFLFRLFTLACRKRNRDLNHRTQYDSTARRYSMNGENEKKKSTDQIKFTLTPAHSTDDLDLEDTQNIDYDDHVDSIVGNKFANEMDTNSLEGNSVRNAKFKVPI